MSVQRCLRNVHALSGKAVRTALPGVFYEIRTSEVAPWCASLAGCCAPETGLVFFAISPLCAAPEVGGCVAVHAWGQRCCVGPKLSPAAGYAPAHHGDRHAVCRAAGHAASGGEHHHRRGNPGLGCHHRERGSHAAAGCAGSAGLVWRWRLQPGPARIRFYRGLQPGRRARWGAAERGGSWRNPSGRHQHRHRGTHRGAPRKRRRSVW